MSEYLTYLVDVFTTDWRPALELITLTVIVYGVFRFLRGTRGAAVLRGAFFAVIGVMALLYIASIALSLTRVTWVLERLAALLAVGVLVIFQPEIRRGLIRLGQSSFANLFMRNTSRLVDEIVEAVGALSKKPTGALLAIQREVPLGDFIQSGVRLEANLSSELVISLFGDASPLHDGAAIIRGGKIAAGGCLLPLTDNPEISRSLGTRHRAGIGLTEQTDAVTVIVSEKGGGLSVGVRGELMQGLSIEDLRGILTRLCADTELGAIRA